MRRLPASAVRCPAAAFPPPPRLAAAFLPLTPLAPATRRRALLARRPSVAASAACLGRPASRDDAGGAPLARADRGLLGHYESHAAAAGSTWQSDARRASSCRLLPHPPSLELGAPWVACGAVSCTAACCARFVPIYCTSSGSACPRMLLAVLHSFVYCFSSLTRKRYKVKQSQGCNHLSTSR